MASLRDCNDIKLTRSQIRYLVAVHRLSHGEGVRSVDIAEALKVSRPSVSRMLSHLAQMELLEKTRDGVVLLTEFGRRLAEERCRELKRLSEQLRTSLTVSSEVAEECALLIISELPQGV